MRASAVVMTVVVLSYTCTVVLGYRGLMVGGRMDIREVETNKEVQELGRFSVAEYNRRYGDHNGGGALMFVEVVEAQRQVVSGIKYYLRIKTWDQKNGISNMFESVVVVKPWLQSKHLLHFGPSTYSLLL